MVVLRRRSLQLHHLKRRTESGELGRTKEQATPLGVRLDEHWNLAGNMRQKNWNLTGNTCQKTLESNWKHAPENI